MAKGKGDSIKKNATKVPSNKEEAKKAQAVKQNTAINATATLTKIRNDTLTAIGEERYGKNYKSLPPEVILAKEYMKGPDSELDRAIKMADAIYKALQSNPQYCREHGIVLKNYGL